jgi:hypothetical protein
MTNFVKPKPRFDRSFAHDGIWVYPVDNVNNEYGGFLVGYFDVSIPRVKVAVEKHQRLSNMAARSKRPENADEIAVRREVETAVDACLLDWDVEDADGKKVPFSKAKAVEYFLTHEIDEETGEKNYIYDFVFKEMFDAARNIHNFQSDEQNAAGEPLGN